MTEAETETGTRTQTQPETNRDTARDRERKQATTLEDALCAVFAQIPNLPTMRAGGCCSPRGFGAGPRNKQFAEALWHGVRRYAP
eukprot:3099701-Alexandrium_andersonii.AAC.1